MANNTVFSMTDICKSFGPVQVLKNINFSVAKGEVRALLGANGAGKSTMIKIMGGVISKNSGEIKLHEKEVSIVSPLDAQAKGISIIHQELSVVSQLTVLDNFFLGREKTKKGIISHKEMIDYYQRICEEMNFDISHNINVRDLSIAKRQMVEIMKAVSYNADIIVMDEPTSSLSKSEKQTLFGIINKLKKDGKTIVYITHMLDEVFTVCDNVSVLLGGKIVGTAPIEEMTQHKIAEMMAGTALEQNHGERVSSANHDESPVMSVKDLGRGKHFSDISFDIYPGEVLGIAGLVGSGRSELVRAIFGADKYDRGEIMLEGKQSPVNSPSDAVKYGIGLIPEDRKNQGLVLKHPIYKNADILNLDKMKRKGMLNKKLEVEYAEKAKDTLSIKLDNVHNAVGNLSGGNQQKVVVAKWLEKELKVLIFDEPTKGIDVRAKEDIFSSVAQFAKRGVAVIFISSDLEEVLRVSDRIAIMHAGKFKKILNNEALTMPDIMNEILVTK